MIRLIVCGVLLLTPWYLASGQGVSDCSDPLACNYTSDASGDGICDEFEVAGCTDVSACNYAAAATNNYGCSATSESLVYIAPNVGNVDAIEWKVYWNTTTGCIESNQVIDLCEVHSLDGRLLSSHRDGCLDAFSYLSGDSFHIVRLHSGSEVKTKR